MPGWGWVAIVAAAIGIVVSVTTLVLMIKKSGAESQEVKDAVSSLKEWQEKNQDSFKEIVNDIKLHVSNAAIHVNPVLEQREYQERKDFERKVENKLDVLLDRKDR